MIVSAFGASAAAAEPANRPSTQAAEREQRWFGKVSHTPEAPKSNQAVAIVAMVAPGVKRVRLEYQIVEPGQYIELRDAQYARDWAGVEMTAEQGEAGKKFLSYAAQVPGDVQKHRRLVRYRIKAEDPAGQPLVWPLAAVDPIMIGGSGSPPSAPAPSNYAYFVYDGLPAWGGAVNPRGRGPQQTEVMTFGPEVLGRVQVYHLLGKKRSIENATWNEQDYTDNTYKYTGTLVVDGRVYDHVRYRARGGVWRYALGKNMWKIDLPPGQSVKAKDDLGRPYPFGWTKLNLRSCFQLGAYGHRGEQGMFEAVNFRLWNMVGVAAPYLHWIHLRIIDEPEEAPGDQYRGDFWGLYQAIENLDGRFLKTHGLPDGNVYKMEIADDELNHHGEGQPADFSDLKGFLRTQERTRPTEQWWRENLNLPSYYSYRSIIECVRHYDIGEGKNYSYYRNPKSGQWQVFPWDADLSWADRMFGDGEEPLNTYVLGRPVFQVEYRNRLREIRDLLFNPEQMEQLIDEVAAIVWDPAQPNSGILEADRRKWDYHPRVTNHRHAGQGRYYRAGATGDFAGMIKLMKDYVVSRGFWVDQQILRDPLIPPAPTLNYLGPAGFPANGLRFAPGPYKGRTPFAAVKWRIAEIIPGDRVKADPHSPQAYEITPVWESEELEQIGEIAIPPDGLKSGHTYRVRVRFKDASKRWSHWSAPVEFTLGGK
jgi:hypothetical protein